MRDVQIQIEALRARVQDNRDKHREVYEAAHEGWKQAAMTWFEVQATRAVNGEEFATYFSEPEPEDHTADYDAVLDMLEMDERDLITLTNQEFRQYVRDEWGWKRQWSETTSNYLRTSDAT